MAPRARLHRTTLPGCRTSLAELLAVPELRRAILAFAAEGVRAQRLSWNATPFDEPEDWDREFQKLDAISCGPELWLPLAPLRRSRLDRPDSLEWSFGVWRAGPSVYVNAGNLQHPPSDRDEDYAEDDPQDDFESSEVVQVGEFCSAVYCRDGGTLYKLALGAASQYFSRLLPPVTLPCILYQHVCLGCEGDESYDLVKV
jgi:hypothetical protein